MLALPESYLPPDGSRKRPPDSGGRLAEGVPGQHRSQSERQSAHTGGSPSCDRSHFAMTVASPTMQIAPSLLNSSGLGTGGHKANESNARLPRLSLDCLVLARDGPTISNQIFRRSSQCTRYATSTAETKMWQMRSPNSPA